MCGWRSWGGGGGVYMYSCWRGWWGAFIWFFLLLFMEVMLDGGF